MTTTPTDADRRAAEEVLNKVFDSNNFGCSVGQWDFALPLIAAAIAGARPRWLPIDEKTPKEIPVLGGVWHEGFFITKVVNFWQHAGRWDLIEVSNYCALSPTHYQPIQMPLPEPPTAAAKAEKGEG